MNYKGICRTAPATPGLLITAAAGASTTRIIYVVMVCNGLRNNLDLIAALPFSLHHCALLADSWVLQAFLFFPFSDVLFVSLFVSSLKNI